MIRLSLRKRLHASSGEIDLETEMEIGSGELIALFGASGSGKTTLLRMLAGLTRPDAGRIEADGEVWFDHAKGIDLPPQRRRVGMVFQDYALFPNMTVRGNLEFALKDRRRGDRVDAILAATHLTELAARLPDTLSGGQKQRAALARALVSEPRLLLLDEPLSALDPQMRAHLQEEILALQRRFSLSAILVSHDTAEVHRMAARVYCLEDGRIARQGAPAAVFGAGRISNKLRLTGVLLETKPAGVIVLLTILIGSEVVKVTALPEDVEGLKPGDKVFLAAKAFNPLVFRAE
ncbi:MAG: ATP-binding cassette domain-containing protein [Fibrobacteria bacterium]